VPSNSEVIIDNNQGTIMKKTVKAGEADHFENVDVSSIESILLNLAENRVKVK